MQIARYFPALFLLQACGSTETVFPPGLEPIGDLKVSRDDTSEANLEEGLLLEAGIDEDIWVHARGYVHAGVADVWGALQDERVFIDRRAVSEYSIEWDTEPEYDVSFLVSQSVEDILTVEYDVGWRHGVAGGTIEAPEALAIRFQKVSGTSLIERMEGSIVVLEVQEGISEVQFQEHMETPLPDTSDLESYIQDLYTEILLFVKGSPLPSYED